MPVLLKKVMGKLVMVLQNLEENWLPQMLLMNGCVGESWEERAPWTGKFTSEVKSFLRWQNELAFTATLRRGWILDLDSQIKVLV